MLRAKISEVKQCPSCGWIMRLQVDPDEHSRKTDTANLSVVRFTCARIARATTLSVRPDGTQARAPKAKRQRPPDCSKCCCTSC
jgi:hypothetical protein